MNDSRYDVLYNYWGGFVSIIFTSDAARAKALAVNVTDTAPYPAVSFAFISSILEHGLGLRSRTYNSGGAQ